MFSIETTGVQRNVTVLLVSSEERTLPPSPTPLIKYTKATNNTDGDDEGTEGWPKYTTGNKENCTKLQLRVVVGLVVEVVNEQAVTGVEYVVVVLNEIFEEMIILLVPHQGTVRKRFTSVWKFRMNRLRL